MEEKSSAESRSLLNATAGWLRWDRTWGECLRALPTPPPRPSPPHAAARCGRSPGAAPHACPESSPEGASCAREVGERKNRKEKNRNKKKSNPRPSIFSEEGKVEMNFSPGPSVHCGQSGAAVPLSRCARRDPAGQARGR